ncbi:MAG: 2-C-methyl-D-erythritol 4-phosphate cytidylyltransferase [Lysobacteraceae bacterium]
MSTESRVPAIWAIVPAAGRGERLGSAIPKQYLALAGSRVIVHAIRRLLAHPQTAGVIVALAEDDSHWSGLRANFDKPVLTCVGGATRAQSVLAALHALPDSVDDATLIVVHDAARPCLDADDLEHVIDAAGLDAVGALLALSVTDTLKRADLSYRVLATEAREQFWRAQTPQVFRRGLLIRALTEAEAAGATVTDESMAVERLGMRPQLVEGSADNIKITVASDLLQAEQILLRQARMSA